MRAHDNDVHLAYTLVIALSFVGKTAFRRNVRTTRFRSNLHVTVNRYVIITHQTTKFLFVNGEAFRFAL